MPTIVNTINIAKLSQFIATRDAAVNGLFGKKYDPLLALKLYTERKSLEWMYDLDPTEDTLQANANYVYSLCNNNLEAGAILNVNGSLPTPPSSQSSTVIPSPIYITGGDFADATNWNGQNSESVTIATSYTLQVYFNDVNRFLIEGSEWQRTASGVEILLAGFDATSTNLTSVFYIYISAT